MPFCSKFPTLLKRRHNLLKLIFREITTLRERHPFAVIGTDYVLDVDENPKRARAYPWGLVDVENPEHSDLPALRQLLVKEMVDF